MYRYSFKNSLFLHFLSTIAKIVLIFLIPSQIASAENPPKTVNILTWWDLNPPEINTIVKTKCDVTLHHDDYYSNSEFLKRFNLGASTYDIIIFHETIYSLIKKNIEIIKSTLSDKTKGYEHYIQKHYAASNYPNNIVFFDLMISGIIWNQERIQLSTNDTISSMFKKANNSIVILMNDPYVLSTIEDETNSFEKIVQNTNIYITNGYNKLYKDHNFAFALQMSGDAGFIIKKSEKPLDFLINPDFSYLSSNLLAELNSRQETQCVAKVLASKEVLDIIQKKAYSLSPYGTYKSVDDPILKKIYKQLHNISDIHWATIVSKAEYKNLRKKWDVFAIIPQVLKNTILPRSKF